jgi:hypothetical protein
MFEVNCALAGKKLTIYGLIENMQYESENENLHLIPIIEL